MSSAKKICWQLRGRNRQQTNKCGQILQSWTVDGSCWEKRVFLVKAKLHVSSFLRLENVECTATCLCSTADPVEYFTACLYVSAPSSSSCHDVTNLRQNCLIRVPDFVYGACLELLVCMKWMTSGERLDNTIVNSNVLCSRTIVVEQWSRKKEADTPRALSLPTLRIGALGELPACEACSLLIRSASLCHHWPTSRLIQPFLHFLAFLCLRRPANNRVCVGLRRGRGVRWREASCGHNCPDRVKPGLDSRMGNMAEVVYSLWQEA